MNKNRELIANGEYILSFGAYWMIYAVIGSFASVFLLARGCSNTEIGGVLAAANLLAVIVQPLIADYTDRAGSRGLMLIPAFLALLIMLLTCGLFALSRGLLMLAVYVLILTFHTVIQPLLNSLPFSYAKLGINLSFGIGRAGGSAGFALILAVLGTLVERRGVMVIPFCCEAACGAFVFFMLLTLFSFRRTQRDLGVSVSAADGREKDEHIGIAQFIKRNRLFFVMNLGMAGLFFSNSVLTNYMAQISAAVNGTTEDLGRILSLMALMEIPTMMLYGRIARRFPSALLIRTAAVGFTVKIVMCFMAQSVTGLFAAQFLQLIAFGLIMPAMVYFTGEIMAPGEAVKGQSLFTMMFTASTIVASLAGGWLLDNYGARTLTMTASAVTAAGAVIVMLTVGRVQSAGAENIARRRQM